MGQRRLPSSVALPAVLLRGAGNLACLWVRCSFVSVLSPAGSLQEICGSRVRQFCNHPQECALARMCTCFVKDLPDYGHVGLNLLTSAAQSNGQAHCTMLRRSGLPGEAYSGPVQPIRDSCTQSWPFVIICAASKCLGGGGGGSRSSGIHSCLWLATRSTIWTASGRNT